MFIELKEFYYKNGVYLTKPLLVNVDEISTIGDDEGRYYYDARTITMNNGKSYDVADTYEEITNKIMVGM